MSLADGLLSDLEFDGQQIRVEDIPVNVDVDLISKFRHSESFSRIMSAIESQPLTRDEILGPIEADPEYQLVVEANNLAVEIDDEIGLIQKYIKDKYSGRFPELGSLVPRTLEYISTVKELGNDLDKAKDDIAILRQFLSPASTTRGQMLNQDELNEINNTCDMALDLVKNKLKINEYVESRMAIIAPNLSAMLGPSIGAKLMGVVGGLTNLSNMVARDILVLGSQTCELVYSSNIVRHTPPDLRRDAANMLATKSALVARVDSCHESRNGWKGRSLLESIESRLERMQERMEEERIYATELDKQANLIIFGEIEKYVGELI